MSKIKICAITTVPETMKAFVIESMIYLHQKGYDVTLLCDMDEEFIQSQQDYFRLISIPMERKADLLGGIKATIAFCKIFRQHKFDMIQYATPNASFYASLSAWLMRVPVRVYCQWGLRYVGFTGVKREIFKLFEMITCVFSTHVRPVSLKNMEFAIQDGLFKAGKGAVLGHGGAIGIDFNKYDIGNKEEYREVIRSKYNIQDSMVFGFIGSVRRDKGVNELLEAFKELCDEYENLSLMILGRVFTGDPLNTDLYEWSEQSDNVIYCGQVDDVYKYLAAMDIVVHPSYREGFSMVLQEAAAMELPIITTDIPGPSEVISENVTGLLIPPKDAKQLKNKMELLLNDKTLCKRFGIQGRRRVEELFKRSDMLEYIYQDRTNILKEIRGEK